MLFAFLDPRTGLVNHVIGFLGLGPIQFMQDPDWFRHLYVWSGVWQTLGWSTIIYLAALAGVNPELHQAAEVDGANRLQRIRHVNIPAIMPRSEEHTSELQSRGHLVCRLLLEKT